MDGLHENVGPHWLAQVHLTVVSMQSTGVYWIPLHDILERRDFEVYLVDARHAKNLPGRKSDVQESQWLLKLHTYGRLNNSFQPPSEIRKLRTYWRQRAEHVAGAATCIQRMQKALTQMNLQLANALEPECLDNPTATARGDSQHGADRSETLKLFVVSDDWRRSTLLSSR
jgi:transposase